MFTLIWNVYTVSFHVRRESETLTATENSLGLAEVSNNLLLYKNQFKL